VATVLRGEERVSDREDVSSCEVSYINYWKHHLRHAILGTSQDGVDGVARGVEALFVQGWSRDEIWQQAGNFGVFLIFQKLIPDLPLSSVFGDFVWSTDQGLVCPLKTVCVDAIFTRHLANN